MQTCGELSMRLVELKEIWFRENNIGIRAVFAKKDGFMDSVFFGEGSTICFHNGTLSLPNKQKISFSSIANVGENTIELFRDWIKSQNSDSKEKLNWIIYRQRKYTRFSRKEEEPIENRFGEFTVLKDDIEELLNAKIDINYNFTMGDIEAYRFSCDEPWQFINISNDDLTKGTILEVSQNPPEKDIMEATKKFLGK
jgi:hypothetical protein